MGIKVSVWNAARDNTGMRSGADGLSMASASTGMVGGASHLDEELQAANSC